MINYSLGAPDCLFTEALEYLQLKLGRTGWTIIKCSDTIRVGILLPLTFRSRIHTSVLCLTMNVKGMKLNYQEVSCLQ